VGEFVDSQMSLRVTTSIARNNSLLNDEQGKVRNIYIAQTKHNKETKQ